MKTKESQTADLQEILKLQQEETSKAKEELKGALSAMEQLKEGFKPNVQTGRLKRLRY